MITTKGFRLQIYFYIFARKKQTRKDDAKVKISMFKYLIFFKDIFQE